MVQNRINGFIALHSLALCATLCASFVATLIFFHVTQVVVLNGDVNFELYSLGLLAAGLSIHRHLRAFARRYGRLTHRENFHLSVNQLTRVMLVVFAIAFVTKDVGVSRTFLLVFIGVSGVTLVLANIVLPRVLAVIFLRDSVQRTVIAATSADAMRLQKWMERYSEVGIRLVGYVSNQPAADSTALRWLGEPKQLDAVVRRESIDQVLIDQAIFNRVESREIIDQCERLGCRVRSFIDITSILPSRNAAFEHDGRYAFATVTPEPLDNPLNQVAKRALDIAISLPVVLFILPITLLITAIAQKIQSPGPLLYYQLRSGINRQRFVILKIRTMHHASANRAAQQATRNDARIYPFGRFLRRTSLDELPQFLNVLRGDMSVSGPRPHLIEHDEAFARVISAYRKRHFVKPGITGLAQSKGCRGEVEESATIVRRVRYDMHYVAKWTLMMDLRIIANTIRQIVFPPPSAY